MSAVLRVSLVLVLLALGAGVAALGFADLKPPAERVEIVLPDERFPR